MEQVIYSSRIRDKLVLLSGILYDKGYFGFMEQSEDYVNRIYDFIDSIPSARHHKCKKDKYGKWYAVYRPAKGRTSYYVTFSKKGDRYYIENIFTNHTKDYPSFIKGIK